MKSICVDKKSSTIWNRLFFIHDFFEDQPLCNVYQPEEKYGNYIDYNETIYHYKNKAKFKMTWYYFSMNDWFLLISFCWFSIHEFSCVFSWPFSRRKLFYIHCKHDFLHLSEAYPHVSSRATLLQSTLEASINDLKI